MGVLRPVGIQGHLQGENIQLYNLLYVIVIQGVVLEVKRSIENHFHFWAKIPIFDTSVCFITRFHFQMALQNEQKT